MKILLVDDHSVVRAGVKLLLGALENIEVLEASNGQDTLDIYKAHKPDITLLDLNVPGIGGLELLRRLKLLNKNARVIVLSMHTEPTYAARALKLGAAGYVSKGAEPDELLLAIDKVAQGSHHVEQAIASELAVGQYRGGNPLDELTAREIDVVRLLAEGKTVKSIAESLGLSYKTVANSCTNIKHKLGLDSTVDLIKLALELEP